MSNELKIIPLGGMGNVTKNMFVYETEKEILIVDCGIGFPDPTMLGVDLLLPDVNYLEDKKNKVVGMLLTHGHDDHIAGLSYLWSRLPRMPIFASKLTKGFAMDRLRDHEIDGQITEIDTSEFRVGDFEVTPVRVTHSVPDSRHFAITTPVGTVYHGSDFKLDKAPVDGRETDVEAIKALGQKGIKILLSDALRSERSGWSNSESSLEATFEQEIQGVEGKFIVTLMSSNIHRVQQAVDVATRHGRQIALLGRSIEQNLITAETLGFIKLPNKLVHKRDIEKLNPKEVCLIIAGSQGQEGSSLRRASMGEHDLVTIKPEDKVVFATDAIPGNEINLNETIDNVSLLGADVTYADNNEETLHVSGHASADELKQMISWLNPEYLVPIGGSYRHLVQYGKIANTMGYKKDQVLILKEGETVVAYDDKVTKGETLDLAEVIVDGLGIGDVGKVVLEDRRRMASNGIVVLVMLVDRQTRKLIGEPEVISRGFVYMKQAKQLTARLGSEAAKNFPKEFNRENWSEIKRKIERKLERLIYKETQRNPLVLSVIREV